MNYYLVETTKEAWSQNKITQKLALSFPHVDLAVYWLGLEN